MIDPAGSLSGRANREKEMSQYNEVLSAEHQFIKHRRRAAGLREREPNKDAIGLALSGGGIRSAIFNELMSRGV